MPSEPRFSDNTRVPLASLTTYNRYAVSEYNETTPWEIQDGEPHEWFVAFMAYVMCGPNRSLTMAYRRSLQAQGSDENAIVKATPPVGWQNAFRRWRWRERAEAWDRDRIRQIRQDIEDERVTARKKRVALLDAGIAKIHEMLRMLDPSTASWRSVFDGMRIVSEQHRFEFSESQAFGIDDAGIVEATEDESIDNAAREFEAIMVDVVRRRNTSGSDQLTK